MKTLLRCGILPLLLQFPLLLFPGPISLLAADPPTELTFDRDILPIFRDKCIRCHAGVEPKAGLNLTSPASLLTGGKSAQRCGSGPPNSVGSMKKSVPAKCRLSVSH
jgi:hypothetical protein